MILSGIGDKWSKLHYLKDNAHYQSLSENMVLSKNLPDSTLTQGSHIVSDNMVLTRYYLKDNGPYLKDTDHSSSLR